MHAGSFFRSVDSLFHSFVTTVWHASNSMPSPARKAGFTPSRATAVCWSRDTVLQVCEEACKDRGDNMRSILLNSHRSVRRYRFVTSMVRVDLFAIWMRTPESVILHIFPLNGRRRGTMTLSRPSSHQDRHLQPAPAPGSVVLR